MLGAMNSKLNIKYILLNLFISNIKYCLRKYTNKCTVSTNIEPKFDPNNKNKWKKILGRKGIQEHSFKLANYYIKNKTPVNALVINNILSYSKIKVTDKELNELVNYPFYSFNCSNLIQLRTKLKKLIGSIGAKKQIPGVYIFIHKDTKSKYVGSSSQLAIRLNGYFTKKHRPSGLFLPLYYKEGLSNFILKIIPLNKNKLDKAEIILEQFYLLDPSFNLNTIRVANNPSGSNSKQLFMYNRDKTILYYYSLQQKDFIINLNIHHNTLTKHLNNNTYYLGKYFFSRELYLNAKKVNISLLDLALKLKKDRKVFNINKPLNSTSIKVLLKSINNKEDIKIFFSLNKCIVFFNEKGFKADKRMLVKCIKFKIPYFGFYCKYI